MFLALDRAGVDATKEQDPSSDGRWRVSVAREDVARALIAMRDDGLPRRDPATVEAAGGGKGALVPSETAEQAQLLSATSADLRASLESVEGVLGARVHLSSPPATPFRDGALPVGRGSASVLLEYRGATPPLSADAVARLVAGAVSSLAPTDVAVVMVSRSAPAAPSGGVLAHVGPIAVARSSAQKLQAALACLVSLVAILAGAVLLLYSRLAQARSGAGPLASAAPAASAEAHGGEP